MSGFEIIENKLNQFTKKYYVNDLIKGSILFFSLGFLYLFFTLFIEYFLWLKPTARTLLFWLFVLVEVFLLIRFIIIPIFKLLGLRKGISFTASSKIIGKHFPEVKDKLLNVLQLKENTQQSDLLLASIYQKSLELQPIPFVKAVDFKKNKKYLKYAIIPGLIWLITLFTGNNGILTQSLNRVVNHRTAYSPPAPFSFILVNQNLQVIQGKSLNINFQTTGKVLPSEAKIIFNNQQYYLQNNQKGAFSYIFSDVQKSINFVVEANGVQSNEYRIEVINTPTINSISLQLIYPNYIGKRNEVIKNTGSIVVPEGTKIEWKVQATQTDSVTFISNNKRTNFKNTTNTSFAHSKIILKSFNYHISSSNKALKDYDNLQFSLAIVKDEAPSISVQSNIDSISRGVAQFAGQISDDYGLKKLQIVYYDDKNPENQQIVNLQISKQNIQTFFYQFPDGLNLKPGINYELYFEVFDNDAVNGNKKAKSEIFNYRKKTTEEVDEELLQEQKNTINSLETSIIKQQKQQYELNKIQQDLQKKKNLTWNDKKKISNFIKRQEDYKKIIQRQTDQLQENLDEKKEANKSIQEKKEALKKRIEELKHLVKQQKLLDEIKKIAFKLNKEDLVKKAKELAQQNKQQRRGLERILELTKRFYIEQKTIQISNKLDKLAIKQSQLVKKEDTILDKQQKINKEFKQLKLELDELAKDNENLKEPMDLPDVEDEKDAIDEELKNAEENLEKQEKKSAKKNQKKSAEKMKEMSAKMEKAMMEMEGESLEENMDDLRAILENLLTFSFKQESLMNKFDQIFTGHPDFGKDLKKQNEIKTYFEHIDDSLYVLSMRLPKISAKIQDDLATAHYNLNQSLENFSENRFSNGVSNQRYVMTSTNNLADYLSNILSSMKNASIKKGKGKGKGSGFSLPDIIKKQGDLAKKMQLGTKPGNKPGDKQVKGDKKGSKPGEKGKPGEKDTSGQKAKDGKNGKNKGDGKGVKSSDNGGKSSGDNDDLDGEIYEIYKQQNQLRQELQNAIKQSETVNTAGNKVVKKVLKTMEQLENEILEKGFNAAIAQKMQNLNYDLLKLEKASLEQGEDKKRISIVNLNEYQKTNLKALQLKKLRYKQTEILNRQSLPLQQNYKLKVRKYFSQLDKKDK